MWVFSRYGFYSVVRKPSDGGNDVYHLRARVREDLERLKKAAGISGEIIESKFADYRFRLLLSKEELDRVMLVLADSVDYPNFKDEVAKQAGQRDRLNSYARIWAEMARLQDKSI